MIIVCNEKKVPRGYDGWDVIKKIGNPDYCPGIWKRKSENGAGWQIVVDTEEFSKSNDEVRRVLEEVLYVEDYRRIYCEELEMDELLDKLDEAILPILKDLPSFAFDCDVYSIHRDDYGAYVSLTDDAYGKYRLDAVIYNDIKGEPLKVALNKRIRVYGFIADNPGHGTMRLMPYRVELTGEPTRAQQQRIDWKERIGRNPPVMGRMLTKDFAFAKIGLIAPSETAVSYMDFMAVLEKNSVEVKVVPRFGRMDAFSISERLQDLVKEGDVEAVCIIRGGANNPHFEMLTLDSPTLCQAVAESTKPVMAGIGHTSDNPYFTKYVDYNAKSAADLAYKLSRVYTLPEAKQKVQEEIQEKTEGSTLYVFVNKLFEFMGWDFGKRKSCKE